MQWILDRHLFLVSYLHLVAHSALGHTMSRSSSGPQVGEAFDGQWIATVAISGHFKVQITVVWKEKEREKYPKCEWNPSWNLDLCYGSQIWQKFISMENIGKHCFCLFYVCVEACSTLSAAAVVWILVMGECSLKLTFVLTNNRTSVNGDIKKSSLHKELILQPLQQLSVSTDVQKSRCQESLVILTKTIYITDFKFRVCLNTTVL